MLSDHLKTCDYCKAEALKPKYKQTIKIKAASSPSHSQKKNKLAGLASYIKGTAAPAELPVQSQLRTKGASSYSKYDPTERTVKLEMLGKMVRGAFSPV